jgi:hypothetical protein
VHKKIVRENELEIFVVSKKYSPERIFPDATFLIIKPLILSDDAEGTPDFRYKCFSHLYSDGLGIGELAAIRTGIFEQPLLITRPERKIGQKS